MKKLRIVRYLAYFTIILTLLSVFPESALSAKDSSDQGNEHQNQYILENSRGAYNNETDGENGTGNSELDPKKFQNNLSVKDHGISEYEQEKTKIKEELQVQRKEYQGAKEDFLEIKNRIRAKKLDPNSNEALNATKLYLNSSIGYMIAHLSSVKNNIADSNGNGKEEKIAAMDEKIKLLEVERTKVVNASSQRELVVTVRSVRSVWDDAQRISLGGSGQIVSEKIGEFLEKSDTLSAKIGTDIELLNKTGVETSDLETKLASYNSYIRSAQEKKEKADSIYDGENATPENMEKANNYLRQSISDINKANKILREIFEGLKEYETELTNETNETNVEKSLKAQLNGTEYINSTNNGSSM
jgi:hypothetical protein